MSHFTVAVIGDVEEVLAPYSEQDENVFTRHDVTEDYLADFETHKANEEFLKKYPEGGFENFMEWWCRKPTYVEGEDDEKIEIAEDNRERYVLKKKDGTYKVFGFWNDKAKWDWYDEDGGRWAGNAPFIRKDGTRGDRVRLCELDVDAMIAESENKARMNYREVIAKLGKVPQVEKTWAKICEETEAKENPDWDKARAEYHAQPDVKLFKEKVSSWGDNVEEYACTEDEYASRAELPIWAVATYEGWFEATSMGWWGMHADYDGKAWNEQIVKILRNAVANADEFEEISIVDCHI